MKTISTLKEAEESSEAAKAFYRRFIEQAAANYPGGKMGMSMNFFKKSDSYVDMMLKRDSFSVLRRAAKTIASAGRTSGESGTD